MGTHPIFESDFDCLTEVKMNRTCALLMLRRGDKIKHLDLKQWMYRARVLKLYQRLLRGVQQCPSESERAYYTKWASDEFKALRESGDDYLIKNKLLEAEQWAAQFEKIYQRTTDGFEKKK